MEAGTNELIQRLFAMLKQKRCCSNIKGNAKMIFLPRQRYRCVEAWLYFTKTRQNMLTPIY